MKKIIKLIMSITLVSAVIVAQDLPHNYELGKRALHKGSSQPVGNSILDFEIIGEAVIVKSNQALNITEDRGLSWRTILFEEMFDDTSRLSFLDAEDGILWASHSHSIEFNGDDVQVGDGFAYSSDLGENWTFVPQPVDDVSDSLISYGNNILKIVPVNVRQQNIGYDLSFTGNTIWVALWAGGLRKSVDMGQTWERVVLPPDTLDSISPDEVLNFKIASGPVDNHKVFSVETIGEDTVLVGTAGGLNISIDGGISWVKCNHLNREQPFGGDWIIDVKYNPITKTIWTTNWITYGGGTQHSGVSSSSDFGQSWTTYLSGEKPWYLGFVGTDILAPTDNGLFRSSNNGQSWYEAGVIRDKNKGIEITTKSVYAVIAQNIDYSTNDIWVGTSSGLAMMTESNSQWDGEWTVFLESKELESKTETYAFPNPFRPTAGPVKIKYSLNKSSADVTIRIMDFGMNLVRTVIQNSTRSNEGEKIELWDGKDERGVTVPNGVYFYRIDVDSDEPLFGKILVIQ